MAHVTCDMSRDASAGDMMYHVSGVNAGT